MAPFYIHTIILHRTENWLREDDLFILHSEYSCLVAFYVVVYPPSINVAAIPGNANAKAIRFKKALVFFSSYTLNYNSSLFNLSILLLSGQFDL